MAHNPLATPRRIDAVNTRLRREKLIAAAEGYLALDLPEQALESLAAAPEPEQAVYMIAFLQGMSLRLLERYDEALDAFHRASAVNPKNIDLLLAMAWCYKRVDRLDLAINATEQAYQVSPKKALILYNLACYYALAGRKQDALSWLGRALRIDQSYVEMVAGEHDFDAIRHDIDFQQLLRFSQQPAESPTRIV